MACVGATDEGGPLELEQQEEQRPRQWSQGLNEIGQAQLKSSANARRSGSSTGGGEQDASTSDSSATSQPFQDVTSTVTAASMPTSTVAGTPPSAVDSGQKSPMPTEVRRFLLLLQPVLLCSKLIASHSKIFVTAARYLNSRDLVSATQVCQSWRRALHANSTLWQCCNLYIDSPLAVEKLRAWCMRANRSLAILNICLSPDSQDWSVDWMQQRASDIRRTILDFDGGANVSWLTFNAFDLSVFSYVAFACFCEHLLRPDAGTGYLCNPRVITQCDVKVPFHLFPVAKGFLHYFAAIDNVQILSKPAAPIDLTQQVDFFKVSSTCLAGPSQPMFGDLMGQSKTQFLNLFGLNLLHNIFTPDCSNLCDLQLSNCQIGRAFFYMLQNAAPQLETLTTINLSIWAPDLQILQAEEFYQEGQTLAEDSVVEDEEDLDEWDLARNRVCITLPNLKELRGRGRRMPAWWQADMSEHPGQPDVYMPALQIAIFDDLDTLDDAATPRVTQCPRRRRVLEMQLEAGEVPEFLDDEEDISLAFPPLPALWNITSVAQGLCHLDISRCFLSDQSLHTSLRFAPSLRTLIMRDMPDISDHGGLALCYLPYLRCIDIRGTDINAYTVARVYETIRECGTSRLERVLMDDPGPYFEDEYGYRALLAYTWMEWIGIVEDWQSREYTKTWLKKPWEDRNLDLGEQEVFFSGSQ